jgi:hypothetical protein
MRLRIVKMAQKSSLVLPLEAFLETCLATTGVWNIWVNGR